MYLTISLLRRLKKLNEKIRKYIVRISRKLNLYLKTITPRFLYSFRHSFANQRDKNNVPINFVSIHLNKSDEMIRKYYRSKSEYQISLDHFKVFPESSDFI